MIAYYRRLLLTRLLLPKERLLPKLPDDGRLLGFDLPEERKVLVPKPEPVGRLPVLKRGVVRLAIGWL